LLLCVSAAVVYQCIARSRGPSDVLFPCALYLFIQSVIYPWHVFRTGAIRSVYFAHSAPSFLTAILIWISGIGAFFLGISVVRRRTVVLPAVAQVVRPDRSPVLVVVPMMLLSVLGTVCLVILRGGLLALVDANTASDTIRLQRGLGVLRPMIFMSYVAVAYLGGQAYLDRANRRKILLAGVICCLLGSIVPLLMGRRGYLPFHLVLLFLPFLVSFACTRVRWYLLLFLLAVFYGDGITSAIRKAYYQGEEIRVQTVVAAYRELNSGPSPLSFDHLELTAAVLSHMDSGEFVPMGGRTFLNGAFNWLPRRVFPDKGWTGGPYLADLMSGGYSFSDKRKSSSMTTGLILESLMNFGEVGVFFAVFVGGVLVAIAYGRCIRDIKTGFDLTVWSVAYFFLPVLFTDDFGGFVNKWVCLLFGLLFLNFVRLLVTLNRSVLRVATVDREPLSGESHSEIVRGCQRRYC